MKRLVPIAVLALVIGASVLERTSFSAFIGRLGTAGRGLVVSAPGLAGLVTPLVALSAGFFLGRYRTYAIQNRGEARLARAVKKRFRAPDYHLLNHVTLPQKDGTTQIDHILVSRFGVFVVETKDYSGWLFGSADSQYWTQVIYKARFRFQNPLHQNAKHARAVRELLDFLPADTVRPIVVLTGTAELKTPTPDGVFTLAGFLSFLAAQSSEVMSANRMQFCVGRLETTRLAVTKATDVEHVAWVRRRHGDNE